jgi:hypothetical protein
MPFESNKMFVKIELRTLTTIGWEGISFGNTSNISSLNSYNSVASKFSAVMVI